MKNGRRYDFVTVFKNEDHRNRKLIQYKRDAVNFRIASV